MSRLLRRPTSLQLQRYRRSAARRPLLSQARKLKSVVVLCKHDLLQDGLLCRLHFIEVGRCLSIEGPGDLGDEFIFSPRGRAVLKGLSSALKNPRPRTLQSRLFGGWLTSLISKSSDWHAAKSSGSVVMRWDGALSGWAVWPCRPHLLDVGDHLVHEHPLVAFLVDLHADGLHDTRRPVSAVAPSQTLLRERPDTDRTVELTVASTVLPRPSDSSKEHHLENVGRVLYLADGHGLSIVQAVLLPVKAHVEPFFVEAHHVGQRVELEPTPRHLTDEAQRPIHSLPLAFVKKKRLQILPGSFEAELLQIVLQGTFRDVQRSRESPVCRTALDRDRLQLVAKGLEVNALPATSFVTVPHVWRKHAVAPLGIILLAQA